MNFIVTALKSRTTYVLIAMFIIGGLQAITSFLPADWVPFVQGFLTLVGVFTHADGKIKAQGGI